MLRQAALPFEVRRPDVDETPTLRESPQAYVQRLAAQKAAAVAVSGRLTLAADTAVVLDGCILGKPGGQAEGVAMLLALGGRTHSVHTGLCLSDGQRSHTRLASAEVTFRPISDAEAAAYWRTGEPAGKAGGYGIQGIGGILVTHISGGYSTVVGLPLAETEALLQHFRFDPWSHRLARAEVCPD